jgi:hypothetical protein
MLKLNFLDSITVELDFLHSITVELAVIMFEESILEYLYYNLVMEHIRKDLAYFFILYSKLIIIKNIY